MDIHARVQQFLQQNFPLPLREGRRGILNDNFTKAGVVPFLRNPYRYYLMKPVAKNLAMEPPKFQLCKGTRMHWCRMGAGRICRLILSPLPLWERVAQKRRERRVS